MKIPIKDENTPIEIKFIHTFGREWRAWFYDPRPDVWYRTIGRFCPHLHMNGFECLDCAGYYD